MNKQREIEFTAQVARLTAVADKYARMMGGRFVIDKRKLRDWRTRALNQGADDGQ